MLYKIIGAATIGISSICVLAQLLLLPWLHRYTVNLRNDFESRLRKFHHNTRQFDEQFQRLRRLTGNSLNDFQHERTKRQLQECPPPKVGQPGLSGGFGEDGEPGNPGEDGTAGLDAITLLMQEAQKCVICPQGPLGPQGAPGQQGLPGLKGEKGETGEIGTDGIDGEQGPEGMPGLPGIAGKPGKKGQPGAPAPGGTGPPGPPGVKGPPGTTGKQGETGRRNFVVGMPGLDGRHGKQGLDGLEGKPGIRGEKGPPGEDGADARFCPCPSELNKLGNNGGNVDKIRSHLSINNNNPSPPQPSLPPKQKIITSTTTTTAFNKDQIQQIEGVVEKEELTKKEKNSDYEDVAYPNYENDGNDGEENNKEINKEANKEANKEPNNLIIKNKKIQKIKFDNVEMNLEGSLEGTTKQIISETEKTEEQNNNEEDNEEETTTIATRSLLICYPGQLDGNFTKRGAVAGIDYRRNHKLMNYVGEMCENKRNEFCKGRTDSLCLLAKDIPTSYVPWHGIHIHRTADDKNKTILYLSREPVRVNFTNDDRKAKFFAKNINDGGRLWAHSSLWTLGYDMLPKYLDNTLRFFVERGCNCPMKAWYTREKTLSEKCKEEIKKWYEVTEFGNKRCSITKANRTYNLLGKFNIEINFKIFVNNMNATAEFHLHKNKKCVTMYVYGDKIDFAKSVS
uniref:Col_cuticle_N domain-containing protein n=1 Tax=Meloidogyne hapla TaxID=6305 RepID=A0A1I8AZ77_MELHA